MCRVLDKENIEFDIPTCIQIANQTKFFYFYKDNRQVLRCGNDVRDFFDTNDLLNRFHIIS